MNNAPETIYLIPGEDGIVWCDDPAPDEHCDPADAVKYVRADVHQAIIDRQAKAALTGMDAAKRSAEIMERNAKRQLAESNPDVLDSERAANARLTQELDKAQARVAELEDALVWSLGKLSIEVPVSGGNASYIRAFKKAGAVLGRASSESWLLRKQAGAVDKCHINTCLAVSKESVRNHLYQEVRRLRQQAERVGGEQ